MIVNGLICCCCYGVCNISKHMSTDNHTYKYIRRQKFDLEILLRAGWFVGGWVYTSALRVCAFPFALVDMVREALSSALLYVWTYWIINPTTFYTYSLYHRRLWLPVTLRSSYFSKPKQNAENRNSAWVFDIYENHEKYNWVLSSIGRPPTRSEPASPHRVWGSQCFKVKHMLE